MNKRIFFPPWHMGRILLPILLILALITPNLVLAQGSITYGSSVTGSLTAEAPLAIYAFAGSAGDHVSAYVAGLTPQMTPGLSLLGTDQRQLAVSTPDTLLSSDGSIARIMYRLPQTGLYTMMISNTSGVPGDFLLHLSARPSQASAELPQNVPVTFNIPPGAQPVHYSFAAGSGSPLTLFISSETPGFAFNAQVFDGMGQLVGLLDGSALEGVSLIIGPDSGLYEVVVQAKQPNTQGTISLLLIPGSPGPGPGTVPQATPTPPPAVTEAPAGCRITPAGGTNVNLRSGPGIVFPYVGSLSAGSFLQVVGRNPEGTWYMVDNTGIRMWVSGSVTRLEGQCTALDVYQSPPTPTPPPATATPEPPPGAVINFTVNGTGSATILKGGCAMVEWNTANIREVYYQGAGVSGTGSRNECPTNTTTYTLRVILQDGTETVRNVSIIVNELLPILTFPPLLMTPIIIVTLPGP